LLAHGADLNVRDVWGSLPIYAATGNAPMLQFLLARGANVDLKAALDLKRFDLATQLLMEDPSRARFRFGTGLTLLHDLARDGGLEAMKLLLAHGADVNARTNWEATPLHVAAFNGHDAAVRFLLDHGAQVNAKDDRGNTPYAVATQNNHMRCAEILLAHGGSL
jgi:ankyrin repeat protein